MRRKKAEIEAKSVSLFDDKEVQAKKRTSKTAEKENKQTVIKKDKAALKEKETKNSTSKTSIKTKKNGNISNNNIDTIGINNSTFDNIVSLGNQKKKRNKESKDRSTDTLQKSTDNTKRTVKSEKVNTRRTKTDVSDTEDVKRNKRSKSSESAKSSKQSDKFFQSKKQGAVINVTKTRIERERKQYRKEIIGNLIQLNEKPKMTDDDYFVEINLGNDKMLVSPWSVDENNVYHPGKDSEFLVNRLRIKKNEEKKDNSLEEFNRQMKTRYKTWDDASAYQGKLTEAVLTEFADKFNWLILFKSRDMEKYSAKFKKKFKAKYALKVLLDE